MQGDIFWGGLPCTPWLTYNDGEVSLGRSEMNIFLSTVMYFFVCELKKILRILKKIQKPWNVKLANLQIFLLCMMLRKFPLK